MKNTKVESKEILNEMTTQGKVALAATAVTGALGITAIFKKEYRKAIVAGMVTGVATPIVTMLVMNKVKKAPAVQEMVAEINEKYETKKAEMIEDILEDSGLESAEQAVIEVETVEEVSEEPAVVAVTAEEFSEHREEMMEVVDKIVENLKILDERTRAQKQESEGFTELLQQTVKDISKTYVGMSKELKGIKEDIKKNDQSEVTTTTVKEYLQANRRVIMEELGIKGSDLIKEIDIEKFYSEALASTLKEMASENFAKAMLEMIRTEMVATVRAEIKETGIVNELDKVNALIEMMEEKENV